jgi:hypothetical protein
MHLQLHPAARVDLQVHVAYLLERALRATTKGVSDHGRKGLGENRTQPHDLELCARKQAHSQVRILRFRLQVFYITRRGEVPLVLEIAGPGRQPRWLRRL